MSADRRARSSRKLLGGLGTDTNASAKRQRLSGFRVNRELAAILAFFLLIVAVSVGYNVRSTAAERQTALLVNVTARQSTLASRYVTGVLVRSEGMTADPFPFRAALLQSATALLHGGEVPSPQAGSSANIAIPAARGWKLQRKLTQELTLIDDLTAQGDKVMTEGRLSPTYVADILQLRVTAALAQTVTNDAAYQMTVDARAQLVSLMRLEIAVGALGALGTLGMALLLLAASARQSARFRSLVDNASDLITVIVPDGTIRYQSPSVRRVLGYSAEALVGMQIADVVHPTDLPAVEEAMAELSRAPESTVEIDVRVRHRDGSWRVIEGTAINLAHDRGVGGYVLNARDVTETRRAAVELAAARDLALEASLTKSQFLATMSHEIRTPMNAVIGLTQLLLDTSLDGEQREYATGVKVSAENLLTIINDILDFSKIEAGKVDIENVDLNIFSLAEDVGRMLADTAHSKGLELLVDVQPEVPAALRGDPVRMRQVLLNLSSNAVKFTSSGEVVIRVHVVHDSSAAARLRFEVQDSGIGIAAADQERLFVPFSQADASTTRRFGGTGLGLAISKQLVGLMGGELGLISAPNEGSTFWFELSLDRQDAPTAGAAPDGVQSLVGRKVLIVDDNATNRLILRQQLRSWGVQTVEAEDGFQAIDLATSAAAEGEPFEIAVLDLNMPGMDGLDLAAALKSDAATASATLFLLSSSGQRLSREESLVRGLAASLLKPVRQSELFDCLITGLNPEIEAAVAPSPKGAPGSDTDGRAASKGRTILLAEDNTMNQLVASRMLDKLGYSYDIVNNGLEAVAAIRTKNYDAVLMDCQMPEMDGYQATTEIRRVEGAGRRTPIIAMTAHAMAGDREACLAVGMDDYLTKPVRMDSIEVVLDRWIDGPEVPAEDTETVPPVESGPEPLDHVQIDMLRELDDGQGEILAEIIGQYLEQTVDERRGLGQSVADGDPESLRRMAHATKGASANVGANQLAAICGELEAQGRFGQLDGAVQLLDRFDAEFARVRASLDLLMENS